MSLSYHIKAALLTNELRKRLGKTYSKSNSENVIALQLAECGEDHVPFYCHLLIYDYDNTTVYRENYSGITISDLLEAFRLIPNPYLVFDERRKALYVKNEL